MGLIVPLDIPLFREMYPKLADASDAQITLWWGVACELVGNSQSSRIPYNPPHVMTRQIILYAALCHVGSLSRRDGGLVGRLQSAAQGTVNTSLGYTDRANAVWWNQTQCGATVWQLLKPWRTGGIYFTGRRCHA